MSATNHSPHRKMLKDLLKEAGNVLFMILLAVALFAALAYTVTGSTRSTGGDASRESNTLLASQITQYGTTLQQAVMRIKLSNNCTDEQISFENPIISGYTNPNAPANYTCHIFRPEGGNVSFQRPPQGSLDGVNTAGMRYNEYWITGVSKIPHVGTDYVNSTDPNGKELLLIIPWLSGDVCRELNKSLGIPLVSNDAPVTVGTHWDGGYPRWTGSFSGVYGYNIYANGGSNYGKMSACLKGCSGCSPPASGTYAFYHVLIPR